MAAAKPAKMASIIIGTHDGTFHCDEVLACFILRSMKRFKGAKVMRSRNPEKLKSCNLVVDVGGEYCPSENRFDHHQRGFSETMESICGKPWKTKLSSAGLVYAHYGKEMISEVLQIDESSPDLSLVYDNVYESFVEEIDAVDNGINQFDGEPRYKVTSTIGARVSNLNPSWNDKSVNVDGQFNKAMEMVGNEFLSKIEYIYNSWLPARKIVADAIDKRHEVDETGEIIRLSLFAPWKHHLLDIENDCKVEPKIKFVLYEDQSNNWRVQCVPLNSSSFQNRVDLKEAWQGLRDTALSEASGIDGCIFVHANGFIGGNRTYEGALTMARQSLKQ